MLRRPIRVLAYLDWEKGLYLALVLLALVTRLWGLGDRVPSHDESIHMRYSWNLYAGRGFRHDPVMHGPFLFHATALSYFFFSDDDFSARIPVALIGVAVVAFPYLLRRWLGRAGALVTSFFLLISPSIAYYSRYIRHDIPVMLWALIILYAMLSYLEDGRARWLRLMAAGVSLSFATKEVTFIYNAIFGLFLVVLLIARTLRSTQGGEEPGWKAKLAALWRQVCSQRAFDLIVVLGTLCLPFLAPGLIALVGLDPLDYTMPTIVYSAVIVGGFLMISVLIGMSWDWRRWWPAAAIHYAIFVVLYTTFFTNGYGIASGMVGSLGYWLQQHEVERGSQPRYYYTIMVAFYEYLPWLLATAAVIYAGVRAWRDRRLHVTADAPHREVPAGVPFVPLLVWWSVLAWVAYSVAGERMPWLTVHITLPMILLAGWLVGQLVNSVDWAMALRRPTWALAVLAAPLVFAVISLAGAAGEGPFRGVALSQLRTTGRFLGGVMAVAALGAAVVYVVRRVGARLALRVGILLLLMVPVALTIRTSARFCYVTYDNPTEFLVYAHGAPGVNKVMRQVEMLSERTAGGPYRIEVAYGAEGSTFFYWKLRNYPNAQHFGEQPSREQVDVPVIIAGSEQWSALEPYLGTNYLVATYPYLWWPLEDYRDLTLARVGRAFTDPDMRAALWDIWYHRDYSRYAELTDKSLGLDTWPFPYRKDVRLYVRQDVAAQVWESSAVRPIEFTPLLTSETVTPDPYVSGWRDLAARMVIGTKGIELGQLSAPRDVAVDADGFIYVVDSGNHRIQKFAPDGSAVAVWGRQSTTEQETGIPQGFNEPWGIAVGADGTVYVADTWNHRIQKLDREGQPLAWWGSFAQAGIGEAPGVFFGPRDVAVGAQGWLYVTDTGNKRVQVFEPDGTFAFGWGGGGLLEGYLDEPVGIAVGPDGSVVVADTWNKRIQVFDSQGNYLRQWAIAGWQADNVENKPYLAVDAQGFVYVTDPNNYRVLVFDRDGRYILSFGQYGFDERGFAFPTGIAVDDEGAVYVTDAHSGRVLVFDPVVPTVD